MTQWITSCLYSRRIDAAMREGLYSVRTNHHWGHPFTAFIFRGFPNLDFRTTIYLPYIQAGNLLWLINLNK